MIQKGNESYSHHISCHFPVINIKLLKKLHKILHELILTKINVIKMIIRKYFYFCLFFLVISCDLFIVELLHKMEVNNLNLYSDWRIDSNLFLNYYTKTNIHWNYILIRTTIGHVHITKICNLLYEVRIILGAFQWFQCIAMINKTVLYCSSMCCKVL